MPLGAGRYDDLCTDVRTRAEAVGVLLIVFGGNKGEGFSAQLPLELLATVPDVLRDVANQIEASIPHA